MTLNLIIYIYIYHTIRDNDMKGGGTSIYIKMFKFD